MSLEVFRFETFAWGFYFWIFRLEAVACDLSFDSSVWDVSLGNFRLASLAGNFRLGIFA